MSYFGTIVCARCGKECLRRKFAHIQKYCPDCRKLTNKEAATRYYKENKERAQQSHRDYYWNNRKKVLENQRVYRQKEETKARIKLYIEKNREYLRLRERMMSPQRREAARARYKRDRKLILIAKEILKRTGETL